MGRLAIHDMFQTSLSGFWRVLSAHLERTACNHSYGYVPYREVPMPRRPWKGKSGLFGRSPNLVCSALRQNSGS